MVDRDVGVVLLKRVNLNIDDIYKLININLLVSRCRNIVFEVRCFFVMVFVELGKL
jgi:hypothetical protein